MKRTPLHGSLVLRVPIVQANLGVCDSVALAAGVSRAGGLGTLTLNSSETGYVNRVVTGLRRRTKRPVSIALTSPYEPESVLDTCLTLGIRCFQVFWWNGPRIAQRLRGHPDCTLLWQVNSVRQAQDALDSGANVLVLQGNEAGGHVRGPLPIRYLLNAVRETVGTDVPIVAGGGLATRSDIREILDRGANAALLGTRFLLSHESGAARSDKARLICACAADLTIDTTITGEWPCAPRRRLRTDENADRPGLYAGMGIERIHRVLGASEIVRRLNPYR